MSYAHGTLEIDLNNIALNYNYLSLIANTEVAFIKSKKILKNLPQSNHFIQRDVSASGIRELILANINQGTNNKVETSAVVKGDAYGLGASHIAKKLYKEGCRKFFVAHLDEAIRLRADIKEGQIYVFHGIFRGEEDVLIQYNIIPTINHIEQFKLWEKHALKLGKKLDCILQFNTGMNRLEIPEEEIPLILDALKQNKALNPLYIMSHLACADDFSNEFNRVQLEKFNKIKRLFPKVKASFANSSGIFLGHDYHFDLVRPGMALYGLNPCPSLDNNPMLPAISLTTKIIQIKTIPHDTTIGYGCSEKVVKGSVIATIPIGYADGYNRALSNKGIVYINNYPARIVGRVSMDLVNIDITSVPSKFHQLGQEVEIFGKNITPDILASRAAGFNYEFLTSLGKRYKRKYIGE